MTTDPVSKRPRSAPSQGEPPALDAHGRLVADPSRRFPAFRARVHDDDMSRDLPHEWHREHTERDDADGGVWFFASWDPFSTQKTKRAPQGRFDLTQPRGTCYLGESVEVAIRERLARFLAHGVVSSEYLAGRVVTTVASPPGSSVLPELDGVVADTACGEAALCGVTGELSSISSYELASRWAQALADSGHTAMRYAPRYSPGGQELALAVFSEAGAQPQRGGIVRTRPSAEVAVDLGMNVDGVPRAAVAHVDATIDLNDES